MKGSFLDSFMEVVATYHEYVAFFIILIAAAILARWWFDPKFKMKWLGFILLGLGLADYAFMPGILHHYFVEVCNRGDYYKAQLEETEKNIDQIKQDIASYKSELKIDESEYQKLIFELYWNYRVRSISLEAALADIDANPRSEFINLMRVRNNIKKDLYMEKSGNEWLTLAEELRELLKSEIEQCDRDAQKNIPVIKINRAICNKYDSVNKGQLQYQAIKAANIRESNEKESNQIEIVVNNGIKYDKELLDSVKQDLSNLYDRYRMDIDSSKVGEITKFLDKLERLAESGGDNFDLNFIRGRLKNIHADIDNLIQNYQYPQAILELRSAIFTDSDEKDGIFTLVKKLTRTTKQRKDMLETCESLRLDITECLAHSFMVRFDNEFQDAINQLRGLNYSIVEDAKFWQNLLDELQGIKNAIKFMNCSEFTPNYKDRYEKVNEKLRTSVGHNRKLEAHLKRIETQLKEESEELWVALQHYNEAERRFQNEEYAEALEEINKALKIDKNERYQKKKKDIEDYINANNHYEEAVKYNQLMDFGNALTEIEAALELIPNDNVFLDFRDDVKRHNEAENLYKSAQELESKVKYQNAIIVMVKALDLYPSDTRYSNFKEQLQTQMEIQADVEKAEMYYAKALKFRDEKNFPQALAAIDKAIEIAEEKKLVSNDSKYYKLKQEINDLIELENQRIEIEKQLASIKEYIKQKKYDDAISAIKNNISSYPAEQRFVDIKENLAEKLYVDAQNLIKEKNYKQAENIIDMLMQLFPDREKYVKLEQDINDALEEIRALEEKKNRDIEIEKQLVNIDKLINQKEYRAANNAINDNLNLYPSEQKFIDKRREFDNVLSKIKENFAENLYNNAVEFQKNDKPNEALIEIDKALLLYPDNNQYNDLKSKIQLGMYKLEPPKEGSKDNRRVLVLNGVEFPLRWCPPTTSTGYNSTSFLMGTDRAESHFPATPPHYVTLTSGFWIMETEVTNKQWHAIMNAKTKTTEVKDPLWYLGDVPFESAVVTYETVDEESKDDEDRNRFNNRNNRLNNLGNEENLPKTGISWSDCGLFCEKIRSFGIEASLPTEAQWEYACKAGTNELQDDINELAWMSENSYGSTHPVAKKKPNAWGIYDMHGNVSEWCKDYCGYYKDTSSVDPAGPTNGMDRIIRGGSFNDRSYYCSSFYRSFHGQTLRNDTVGARFVFGKYEYVYNGTDPKKLKKVTPVTTADASKQKPPSQTYDQTYDQTDDQTYDQADNQPYDQPSPRFIERPAVQEIWRRARPYIPIQLPF